MFVDCDDSLAFAGGVGGPEALVALSGVAPAEDRFAVALWRACGQAGPPLRVATGATGPLPGPGWRELLVCRAAGLSPYTALRELTAAGEALPGPVACLTLGGDGLHGQHGRAWVAVRGNLHLSVAMPCDLEAALCAPSLPMLAGVALAEAAEDLAGAEAALGAGLGLKWVNDLVAGSDTEGWRKLGGVLTALRTSGPRVTTVFAGLALNLAVAPPLPPDPFALPAAALADAVRPGPPPTLAAAALAVLARLRERLAALAANGPAGLVDAYRARSIVLGREVAVWDAAARLAGTAPVPSPRRRGLVTGILPDLGLLLDGQDEPVRDGCLRLAGEPANR